MKQWNAPILEELDILETACDDSLHGSLHDSYQKGNHKDKNETPTPIPQPPSVGTDCTDTYS